MSWFRKACYLFFCYASQFGQTGNRALVNCNFFIIFVHNPHG